MSTSVHWQNTFPKVHNNYKRIQIVSVSSFQCLIKFTSLEILCKILRIFGWGFSVCCTKIFLGWMILISPNLDYIHKIYLLLRILFLKLYLEELELSPYTLIFLFCSQWILGVSESRVVDFPKRGSISLGTQWFSPYNCWVSEGSLL